MSNVRTQIGKVIGKSLNGYHSRVKPKIDELKFKEEYQGRIIDCMVGEVDDNYIETPETDENIVKLEHSKEGVIKIPQIKGKTILVDADGNETDTPAEGCRLVSVGEEEDNKLIILSNKGANIWNGKIVNENETDFIRILGNDVTITMPLYRKEEGACYIRVDVFDKNKNKTRQFLMGDNYKRQSYSLTQDEFYIKVIGVRKEVPLEVTLESLPFLLHTSPNLVPIGNAIQHKTEILLNEPLRKLPNGICDEIIENKLIRRIGVYKFDENARFGTSGMTPQEKTTIFQGGFANDVKSGSGVYTDGIKTISINSDEEGLCSNLSGTEAKRIYFRFSRDKNLNVDNVHNYICNLNLNILYELEEPIVEELSNGITLQGFDDTTMYIENSITPTVSYGYNALIPYKQELLNQKEEVETNTLDIEQNIIPYLMDMEFNLMLMGDE